MNAERLEELAERLLLGEATTQDIRDAARCAAILAAITKDSPRLVKTAIEAVEGAE